ncbi:hypothetical protein [Brevundimonas poindexterae]|uniref:hypothetical protein n=1 Tax=Brevundimonas poindexterae TaxID=74325 RepID=UPI001CFF444C|nr:hypothetical protein [Brevundimonas poindexterae]
MRRVSILAIALPFLTLGCSRIDLSSVTAQMNGSETILYVDSNLLEFSSDYRKFTLYVSICDHPLYTELSALNAPSREGGLPFGAVPTSLEDRFYDSGSENLAQGWPSQLVAENGECARLVEKTVALPGLSSNVVRVRYEGERTR